jgi:hypothetical protein
MPAPNDALRSRRPIRSATADRHDGTVVGAPASRPDDRGHRHVIRLELGDLAELFNSMDPSPFVDRDLDDDAEEFIVGSARELQSCPLKLRIYLQQWPDEDPQPLVAQAVHNYFAHREHLTELEFKRLMRVGRTSLVIGLVFLAACLVVIRALPSNSASAWAGVLKESLTIAGWVAMWRPMQIYLYDWWPLRQTAGVYRRLSRMPVEVARHATT